jgi:VIT1/CCC1 family predicted Fe2+/Mn2+ transporter
MSQRVSGRPPRRAELEVARAREELERIKSHHSRSGRGGALRAGVFGINDGLVSNFSLVLGVAAANPGPQFVLLAGVAGLIAGAFSMAAGEYVSMRVQREVFEAQIALERQEIEEQPERERQEVEVILRAQGIPPEDAEPLSEKVMADPEVALDLMARQELGLNPDELGSPWGAAISSFISFSVGALIPILSYVLPVGALALAFSIGLSALALFAVGAATARLSDRPLLWGGFRMLLIGGLAASVTYGIGHLLGVSMAGA